MRRLAVALAVTACAYAGHSSRAVSTASFILEDAVRFAEVFARLPSVADSAAFLDTAYVRKGSPGLRAYEARYPLSGDGLVRAIRGFPQDYGSVGRRVNWLATQEDTLRRVVERYSRVVPNAVLLPVYFVV